MWNFPALNNEDWIKKLKSELKDNFDRTNYINSYEDISFDLKQIELAPMRFVNRETSESIFNCFKVEIYNSKEANKIALRALQSGANALWFEDRTDELDCADLFQDIQLEYITVFVNSNNKSKKDLFKSYIEGKNLSDFYLLNTDENSLIEGHKIKEIGGCASAQIAYTLYNAYKVFSKLKEDEIHNLFISIGTSGDYFIDLSTLISIRLLLNLMSKNCNVTNCNLQIVSNISQINKSTVDHETNLLRFTTEVLSSILGECDIVLNQLMTDHNKKDDVFKEITDIVNVFNVLINECGISNQNSFTEGTVIVNAITQQLMDKSWGIFLTNQNANAEEFEKNLSRIVASNRSNIEKLFRNKEKNITGNYLRNSIRHKESSNYQIDKSTIGYSNVKFQDFTS